MKYVVFKVTEWGMRPTGYTLDHFNIIEDAKKYVRQFIDETYSESLRGSEIDYVKSSEDEDEDEWYNTKDYIIYILSDEEFDKEYGKFFAEKEAKKKAQDNKL